MPDDNQLGQNRENQNISNNSEPEDSKRVTPSFPGDLEATPTPFMPSDAKDSSPKTSEPETPTDSAEIPPASPSSTPEAPITSRQSDRQALDLPPVIPAYPKKKFGGKKIIATIFGILLLIGGVAAGVTLVQQQQELRERAATPAECRAQGKCEAGGQCISAGDTACNQDNGCRYTCSNGEWTNPNCQPDNNCPKPPAPGAQTGPSTQGPASPRPTDDVGRPTCGGFNQGCCVEGDGYYCVNQPLYGATKVGEGSCSCGIYPGGPVTLPDQPSVGGTPGEGGVPNELVSFVCDRCSADRRCDANPVRDGGTSARNNPCGQIDECRIKSGNIDFNTCSAVKLCDEFCSGKVITQAPPPSAPESTPTPTPPPSTSPPPPGVTAQCLNIKAFDTNWNQLTSTQLSNLGVGDTVRFTVAGSASSGSFDKARFIINGVQRPEVTGKRPGTGEFYDEYTIQETDLEKSFSVNAQLHHASLGWF